MNSPLEIFTDGAAKGNPGAAAIGVVIKQDGKVIREISETIGEATNNFAEYTALKTALSQAIDLKAKAVKVFSDSELLCRQIRGEYKTKSENLVSLFEDVQRLIRCFESFHIVHIPREQNTDADQLANQAIAKQAKMVAQKSV